VIWQANSRETDATFIRDLLRSFLSDIHPRNRQRGSVTLKIRIATIIIAILLPLVPIAAEPEKRDAIRTSQGQVF
jgi:hypothetical protein